MTTAVVIGEIAGAIGGGMLANALGRKKSMVLVAVTCAAFALLSALSATVSMLLVSRFLLGLTVGVSVVVVPVFVAESAPARIRGSLLVAYQVATVVGIVVGYLAAYFCPRLFEAMGFEGNFALLILPALVQVAALAAVFVSLLLVDRLGRWPILLGGIAMMVVANIMLIGVFLAGTNFGGALTTIGFLGVLLFTMGFNFGFGALVWVYAGESFPSRLRSMGSSAMLTSDLVANAIVAAFFLTILKSLGGAGAFAMFGTLALAAFAFVYRFAPETKGRQLEDIRHFWENGGDWPDANSGTAENTSAVANR